MKKLMVLPVALVSLGALATGPVVIQARIMPAGPLQAQQASSDVVAASMDSPEADPQHEPAQQIATASHVAEQASEVKPVPPAVQKGTFHENVERLAATFGFSPVIWDDRTGQCAWEQVTEYQLPEGDSRTAFAYYVSTLDFKAVFSEVDSHVQLVYVGPISRIQECAYEEE
jgi:hypothetical protein